MSEEDRICFDISVKCFTEALNNILAFLCADVTPYAIICASIVAICIHERERSFWSSVFTGVIRCMPIEVLLVLTVIWFYFFMALATKTALYVMRQLSEEGLRFNFTINFGLSVLIVLTILGLLRLCMSKNTARDSVKQGAVSVDITTIFYSDTCRMCFDAPSTHLFIPCKHMALCESCCLTYCANKPLKEKVKCLLCRKNVEECINLQEVVSFSRTPETKSE